MKRIILNKVVIVVAIIFVISIVASLILKIQKDNSSKESIVEIATDTEDLELEIDIENNPYISVEDIGNGWKRLTHHSGNYSFEYPSKSLYVTSASASEVCLTSVPLYVVFEESRTYEASEPFRVICGEVSQRLRYDSELFNTPIGQSWGNQSVIGNFTVTGQQAVELEEIESYGDEYSQTTREILFLNSSKQTISIYIQLLTPDMSTFQPKWEHIRDSIQLTD